MSNRWERVRLVVPCAFGHQITYPDWAYFAKWRMVLCEACAWKQYKLSPPESSAQLSGVVTVRQTGARE